MSTSWYDYASMATIKKWRDKKVEVSFSNAKVKISRRLLCSIMDHIFDEGFAKMEEKYATQFIEGEGFVPPILQDHQKDVKRGLIGARDRLPEEILDKNDWRYGMGETCQEILAFRKEAKELSDLLEKELDICPRCKCPKEHCSGHC